MRPIYLIGFMGSGKSTFGKKLAESLEWPFFDLDIVIEQKEGKSISELFRTIGETHFREIESKTLRDFAHHKFPFVLATGGGTPCFHHNMEWMNQNGLTLFLDIPISELLDRLIGSDSQRPIIQGMNPEKIKEEITNLHSKRRVFYLKAASRLASNKVDMNEVIHMLNS